MPPIRTPPQTPNPESIDGQGLPTPAISKAARSQKKSDSENVTTRKRKHDDDNRVFMDEIRELIKCYSTETNNKLEALHNAFQDFKLKMQTELADLKVAIGSSNTRLNILEDKVKALEQRPVTGPMEFTHVDGVVEDLRRDLNDRDQELLANDIEISNFPESNAENPVHITKLIGQKLGINLEDRDIVSAERVGGRHLISTSPEGTVECRPRAIVVRLARRDLRDELMNSARVRRGVTTADLSMTGPAKKFYLNERLTKTNRKLFRKTRDAASLHGWKFAWTKRGRILVRHKAGDPPRRIRSEADIVTLIGPTDTTNKS